MTDVLLDVAIRVELLPFELELKATFQHAVTGIYAPSGSGKTSFLRCLAGLQRRVNGHIFFNNQVWLDSKRHINRPPEKRHIGYVPQDGLLFPHKNVRQNLQIGARRAHHKVSLSSVCESLPWVGPCVQTRTYCCWTNRWLPWMLVCVEKFYLSCIVFASCCTFP
ncbi:MAG: ATP-binding cassette domain-containing protein [Gammaproteobacteria bacterium]